MAEHPTLNCKAGTSQTKVIV
jgi:hypothetical protein